MFVCYALRFAIRSLLLREWLQSALNTQNSCERKVEIIAHILFLIISPWDSTCNVCFAWIYSDSDSAKIAGFVQLKVISIVTCVEGKWEDLSCVLICTAPLLHKGTRCCLMEHRALNEQCITDKIFHQVTNHTHTHTHELQTGPKFGHKSNI